jgi:hypothetical protein
MDGSFPWQSISIEFINNPSQKWSSGNNEINKLNMRQYLVLFLAPSLFVWFSTCNSTNEDLRSKHISVDTLINPGLIKIAYKYDLDTVITPRILETSTFMITDSMLDTKEYSILKRDVKRDSLNFMNCVGDKYLPINFYSSKDQILETEVFFPTAGGWFWLGNIQYVGDSLIFGQGSVKKMSGFKYMPIYSKIKFKVYIPGQCKVNHIIFQCD